MKPEIRGDIEIGNIVFSSAVVLLSAALFPKQNGEYGGISEFPLQNKIHLHPQIGLEISKNKEKVSRKMCTDLF